MQTQTMTVLIMTPLKLEYEAVSRHLTDKKSIVKEGAAYETGRFQGKHCTYQVVLAEPGMKNIDMALATERAIRLFQPQLALLIGIAGGIKDLKIGDVAIAKSAFNYDAGKESDNGFLPRPSEYHFSEELLAYAKIVQRSDDWKNRTADGAPHASVHIASVAAGDKVVAAVRNTTFERIEQFLSHCKFLEMEAAGFGLAVQRHRNLHALVVRGISDLCAGKGETDLEGNWQEVAAERAAGVGFELLYGLDASSFIIPIMDTKTLAEEIFALLFPMPLPESVKEIGNDFANATNRNIRALWAKVKPLFIKEAEKLAKNPEDTDRQAALRTVLADALEEEPSLQTEMAKLVESIKQRPPAQAGVSVANSKNVVAGSMIVVKEGGFRLGHTTSYHGKSEQVGRDKLEIHHHYPNSHVGRDPLKPKIASPLPDDFKEKLYELISRGRPEQALDNLSAYTKDNSGEVSQEVVALLGQKQELNRKNRMRIISHENAVLEQNQIVAALLELIK